MGGQTALNLASALAHDGSLARLGVELIGCNLATIDEAEDRDLFKQVCEEVDLPVADAHACSSIDEVLLAAERIGQFPLLIRPAFTLGGLGGGTAWNRGELVEIGGSFRIPDIMLEAGVKLVEVGTTNRCRLSDYEQALTENTAALLKVHPSNYEIKGFTESVSVGKMAGLAHSKGLFCFHDWGSGSFYRFKQRGLSEYATAEQELAAGPDLLAFSGDKLLGGIQAGVLLGKAENIQKLRKHALYRALRLDKVTLALLEETLEVYLDLKRLPELVPTVGMLELTVEEIQKQVKLFLEKLKLPNKSAWECELHKTESRTGGGALPELPLESAALVLSHPEWSANDLQEWFRSQPVPIIVRVHEEQIWLDFRTILPHDSDELMSVITRLI